MSFHVTKYVELAFTTWIAAVERFLACMHVHVGF